MGFNSVFKGLNYYLMYWVTI